MNSVCFAQIKKGNIFEPVKRTPEEFMEVLFSGAASDSVRIERIVSEGHVSPDNFWYEQDEWEWVAVLQGNAELEFKTEKISLVSGDWVLIPAHERHRVSFTSSEPPCVWLAVFGKENKKTE